MWLVSTGAHPASLKCSIMGHVAMVDIQIMMHAQGHVGKQFIQRLKTSTFEVIMG